MIAFELRHQFFNTKNLWFFLQQGEAFVFEWHLHYFIAFFPIIFLIFGFVLNWIFQKNKIIGLLLILFLVFLNFSRLNLYRGNGYTMPEGWNLIGVRRVAEIIIHDEEKDGKNFNIAALLDGDTRAHPFRYLLSVGGEEPMGVEEYPRAEVLYVVGRGDSEEILSYPVWEIYSFLPAEVEKTWEIQNGVKLFKLIKK